MSVWGSKCRLCLMEFGVISIFDKNCNLGSIISSCVLIELKCERESQVMQHIATDTHKYMTKGSDGHKQIMLTQCKTNAVDEDNNFLVNILFSKLENVKMRSFLENWTNHKVPHLTTMRKTHLPMCYNRLFEGDGLPDLICLQCHVLINSFFDFKNMCEQSDITLQDHFKNYKEAAECFQALGSDIQNTTQDKDNATDIIDLVSNVEGVGGVDSLTVYIVDATEDEEQVPVAGIVQCEADATSNCTNFPGKRLFICKICHKSFSKTCYLWQHEEIHKQLYCCKNCGKTFSQNRVLKMHLESRTCYKLQSKSNGVSSHSKITTDVNAEVPQIICKICSKTFTQRSSLKIHLQAHQGEKHHLCEKCGKSFRRATNLRDHKHTHTSAFATTFACKLCNKAFANRKLLREHVRRHAGLKEFLCTMCGKAYAAKSNLVVHERIHTGERPFSCTECNKTFANKMLLRRHEKHHTGKNMFECNLCDKVFFTKAGLDRHALLHIGKKSFSCAICNALFYTLTEVKKHVKYHIGDRPFSCDICSKSFHERHHLSIHQRSHTGERPYRCLVCPSGFTTQSKLTRHLKIHH